MLARSSARRAVGSLLLACVGLSGCYSYAPLDERSPPAGEEVRLRIAEGGQRSVARQSRFSGDDPTLEGSIVDSGPDSVRVAVSRPARARLRTGSTVTDTLRLATGQIRSVQRKTLETGETAALFGGVAAGVGVASALLLSSAGGGAGPAPGQDGPNLTIRIPVP